MKKFILAFILSLVALPVFAQSGTLAASETPATRTTFIVGDVAEHRPDPAIGGDVARVVVSLWKTDAGVTLHDSRDDVRIEMSGAEITAFENARSNVAASETGGGARVQNFRALTYLKANCATFAKPCPATVTGMTVVP